MDEQFASGSSKEAELELLALVIESYERSRVQPSSPDPIEAILFRSDFTEAATQSVDDPKASHGSTYPGRGAHRRLRG